MRRARSLTRRPARPRTSARITRPAGAAGSTSDRKGMNWDMWLGARPVRPYATSEIPNKKTGKTENVGTYHPTRWRGWLDFRSEGHELGHVARRASGAAVCDERDP